MNGYPGASSKGKTETLAAGREEAHGPPMKVLDRFPIKRRGTGITVQLDGATPVTGQRLRRPADGREWVIESVEVPRPGAPSGICLLGDPPAIGDDLEVCG